MTPDDKDRTNGATVHWGWLAAVAALAAYGSLYPFRFLSPPSMRIAWDAFVDRPHWWTSWSDVAGNTLLFIPIGIAIYAASSRRTPVRLALAIALAVAFALLLQVAQIWVPGRSAALSDVVWNAVGCAIGVAAGPVLAHLWQGASVRGLDHRAMPLVLLSLWVLAELAPLVPAFNWQGVKDALRSMRDIDTFSWSMALACAARTVALGTALAALRNDRNTGALLLPMLAATALVKPLIVGQTLTVDDLAGYGLGFALWLSIARWSTDRAAIAAAALLLVAYSIDELRPFSLAARPTSINWVPFSAVLNSTSAANLTALFRSLFTFTAVLWLVDRTGGMPRTSALVIALWVALLEVAQQWISGRSADMTEPVLVLVAGMMVAAARQLHEVLPPRAAQDARRDPARSGDNVMHGTGGFPRGAAIAFVGMWLLTTAALAAMLRVPGIPYNVAAMFLGKGHIFFLAVFALATLWIGTGAAWMAHRVRDSRWPVLAWPGYAVAAAMVCLVLLYGSVTDARIEKISGSNNLWWFVVNKDIWGPFFQGAFAFIGRDVEVFIERPVRFAALYLPPTIFVAAALMMTGDVVATRPGVRGTVTVLLCAVPLLWLCKVIAFDWSSTDNLNELIARDGPYGLGGGGYLYVLLALFAANVALLTRLRLRPLGLVAMVVATAVGLLAGWQLLNLGLESQVEKYGFVFPGAQFLLGPDRQNLLSEAELMARWGTVYFAATVLVAVGARAGWPLMSALGRRLTPQARPRNTMKTA